MAIGRCRKFSALWPLPLFRNRPARQKSQHRAGADRRMQLDLHVVAAEKAPGTTPSVQARWTPVM
jgi:hypothetical protein